MTHSERRGVRCLRARASRTHGRCTCGGSLLWTPAPQNEAQLRTTSPRTRPRPHLITLRKKTICPSQKFQNHVRDCFDLGRDSKKDTKTRQEFVSSLVDLPSGSSLLVSIDT